MSQSIVITFASSKGGVGKSTACAAIAGTLAARHCRVIILDFDQNLTLNRWFTSHKPPIPSVSVVPCQPQAFNQALDAARAENPHFILIDIAGSYEATVIKAISASTLVVTPAKLSEPDLTEAAKILAEVRAFNKRFGVNIQHRVLINEVEPLDPLYQRHTRAELNQSALRHLTNMMVRRAAYREIFISGLPPHFADQSREPVRKAVVELNIIAGELLALIGTPMQEAA